MVLFPYVQAEMTHQLFKSELDGEGLCSDIYEGQIRYWRLTQFNKPQGEATLYCLFEDSQMDRAIDMNYLDSSKTWKSVNTKPLDGEDSDVWPIYL